MRKGRLGSPGTERRELFGSGAAGGAEMGVLRCSQGRVARTASPPSSSLSVCPACPQLVLLSEEKQSLAQENSVLRERVGRPEDEGASGLTAKKLLLLQTQLEQLQEENFRYGQAGDRASRPGAWGRYSPFM